MGYFNTVLGLAEKVKREEEVYPAIYVGNEYKRINLDVNGSVCYWRKDGDVSFSSETNLTQANGLQYKISVPLKLLCFINKENPYNDVYFADNMAMDIIGYLTLTNSALKKSLLAKSARVQAKNYLTDSRAVASEEYTGLVFEPRYTHSYFSIDFEVIVIANQNCYDTFCGQTPVSSGSTVVSILDQDGAVIASVPCGGTYSVVVFSGIDGGSSTTVYTNSIVDA
jgi:hypothetical protein